MFVIKAAKPASATGSSAVSPEIIDLDGDLNVDNGTVNVTSGSGAARHLHDS